MAFDLSEELATLVRIFQVAKMEYAICGGIAVAIHGYPRATRDLDLLVRAQDVEKIVPLVQQAGFTLSAGVIAFDSGKPTERRIVRISKARGQDLLTPDLMLVPSYLEDVWSTREKYLVGDLEMQVVSREGLMKMKRIAGRPTDLADLHGLEAADEP